MVGKDENSTLMSLPTEHVGPCKFGDENIARKCCSGELYKGKVSVVLVTGSVIYCNEYIIVRHQDQGN